MADERTLLSRRAATLKRALLAFWSVWWTVVFATNLADAAKAL